LTVFKNILKKQDWHLVLLALLLALLNTMATWYPQYFLGEFWGISTFSWLWIGVLAAVLHQVYIMLVLRFELETGWLTSNLPRIGYLAYMFDYTLLLIARILALIFVAIANHNTLFISTNNRVFISLLLAIPFLWLIYSVVRYYSLKYFAGAEYFNPENSSRNFPRHGIFKYTGNSIYTIGSLGFYIPGIVFASPAALLLALFNNLYIWVHYYCTELPDKERMDRFRR